MLLVLLPWRKGIGLSVKSGSSLLSVAGSGPVLARTRFRPGCYRVAGQQTDVPCGFGADLANRNQMQCFQGSGCVYDALPAASGSALKSAAECW